MTDLETESTLTGDQRILSEARRRFSQCEGWEGKARKRFLDDLRFANGDGDNGWQWPDEIYTARDLSNKPSLTINIVREQNLQITNDAKQNKAAIKFRAVGNGATFESAQVFEGIARHIEYISNAQSAYDTANKFQVDGGIGYWRVVTDYVGNDSFDQEIYIRRVKDPLSVYIDPDISEVDGSDARFGFIFTDMSREDFNAAYPEHKDRATQTVLDDEAYGWIDDDHVRVAEYFRKSSKRDRLMTFTDPRTGQPIVMRESTLPQEIAHKVIDDPQTRHRLISEDVTEWYLLAGDSIIDRSTWPGKYIPIVRIVGEETIIDGELDRKGHTRNSKDPQKTYNYWTSAAVEHVALQTKIPYLAAAASIEGLETYWEDANTTDSAVLPWKHIDDQGNPIPQPERIQPPAMAQAYVQGMQIARQELMYCSGQYQATFGEPSNEKSGRAINERQRQGDRATYHFIDGQAIGIRFTAKILLDLIPKVYDTPRVLRILAEDGTESHIQLDPSAQQAYLEQRQQQGEEVRAIFNPNVGQYDVEADAGPAYATKRQEAWNAISQILSQAPELVNLIGDLLFTAGDFPLSDQIAERLKRMVPPQALGDGAPPAVTQLQEQLKNLQGMLAKTVEELASERLKSKGKDQQKEINVYKAITDRLDVIAKHIAITPKDSATMLHDLMVEEHSAGLQMVDAVSDQDMEEDLQGKGNG